MPIDGSREISGVDVCHSRDTTRLEYMVDMASEIVISGYVCDFEAAAFYVMLFITKKGLLYTCHITSAKVDQP